jgi:hypothetical protein
MLAAIALAAVSGCPKPQPVSLTQSPRTYTERDYDAKLDQWTRGSHLVVLQGADARLAVDATFLSADFRSAYVARYAHDATLSPGERQQTLSAAMDRSREDHEFYVALETQSLRWGDLTRALSAWHVRLLDDRGNEVQPVRIEAERRITAADREYFPYTTPWRQVFRIHFPRRAVINGVDTEILGPGTRYFILRFGGALGTADLRWDVASEHG